MDKHDVRSAVRKGIRDAEQPSFFERPGDSLSNTDFLFYWPISIFGIGFVILLAITQSMAMFFLVGILGAFTYAKLPYFLALLSSVIWTYLFMKLFNTPQYDGQIVQTMFQLIPEATIFFIVFLSFNALFTWLTR